MRYIKLTGGEWEMDLSVMEFEDDPLGDVQVAVTAEDGSKFIFRAGRCVQYEPGANPSEATRDASKALLGLPTLKRRR